MPDTFNFKKELDMLNIIDKQKNLITQIIKDEKTQKELVETLKSDFQTEEERNSVVEKIIEKSIKQNKNLKKKLEKKDLIEKKEIAYFNSIKKRAEKILDDEHQINCLKGEPKTRELTEEFDQRKDCQGEANYICHHCGRNLCSQHSYWIPDLNFPYINRKIDEGEYEIDPEKEKRAKNLLNIGALILFIGIIVSLIGVFSISILTFGIVFDVFGVILIIVGLILRSQKEEFVGDFYPSFINVRSTKWERRINDNYEHKGYYTAVHCWNCFKKHHKKIFNVAEEIIEEIYEKSEDWEKRLGDVSMEIDNNLRTKCGLYGANKYLNEFKFGKYCHLPLEEDLRIMRRPNFEDGKYYKRDNHSGYYRPTPVWFFKPLKKIKLKKEDFPKIKVEDWVKRNQPEIKRVFNIKMGYY